MENFRNFSIFIIILIPTPDFPHFYFMLGGNLVSLLYGDVFVMLIFAQNIDCGYTLELSHWGGSNKYHQSMF